MITYRDDAARYETWADDGNHGWGFPRTWLGRILDRLAYKCWGPK